MRIPAWQKCFEALMGEGILHNNAEDPPGGHAQYI